MEDKRILVIGGTGFIGKEVCSELLKRGYFVSVLSRKLKESDKVKVLNGSVLDKGFLLRNLKNFDYVIYLASVVKSLVKSRYSENITGLRNTIDAMERNNVSKLIYFSTQNVNIEKTGYYGNSKKECEKSLKESNLDYVIIRPNYVYGVDMDNYFYRMINLIKKTKVCPVIGKGNQKIQPVNKKDLARITVDVIRHFRNKEIIEVSGKDTISINEIIDFIRREGEYKFVKVHLPIKVLKLFKKVIPFDIDGFDEDRIIIENNLSFAYNIKDDLRELIKL